MNNAVVLCRSVLFTRLAVGVVRARALRSDLNREIKLPREKASFVAKVSRNWIPVLFFDAITGSFVSSEKFYVGYDEEKRKKCWGVASNFPTNHRNELTEEKSRIYKFVYSM